MGEELDWDNLPDAAPAHPEDVFAEVKLSPLSIDRVSKIVPEQYWIADGLYTWLLGRANKAFQAMPANHTRIIMGKLRYFFEYESDGPVLRSVSLVEPS